MVGSMSDKSKKYKKPEEDVDKLFKAINENDEENVTLYSTADSVNRLTNDYIFHARITPLFLASKLGRANLVKILLTHGADVNAVDELGRTALLAACEENMEEVIDVLLDSCADPNSGGFDGLQTPSDTCLGAAIKAHNIGVFRKLLNAGVHVNLKNESNRGLNWPYQRVISHGNYLHSTLMQSCPDILELLCKHGCDIETVDDNEETPLFLTVRKQDLDSTRILLKYGANPNAVTELGNTLNIAAATVPANKEMIKLLVSNGAQLNVMERMNRVPLALYLSNFNMNKDVSIIKYLIQHGTILNEFGVINEIKWMLNRLDHFQIVKMAVEGGMDIHGIPWLRKFVESSPDYSIEEEMTFRKYVKPIVYKPHSLSKLCCFYVRNHLMSIGTGKSIAGGIRLLPLPELVKDYLLLEHL